MCVDSDSRTFAWIDAQLRKRKIKFVLEGLTSGRKAFLKLVNEHFDLLITDYPLPDMTGVQLCALLKRNKCRTPVMFFSVLNRAVDKAKAKAAGADEYIDKPDELGMFPKAVKNLLVDPPNKYFAPIGLSGIAGAHSIPIG